MFTLVVVAHGQLAPALAAAAEVIVGPVPALATLSLSQDDPPQDLDLPLVQLASAADGLLVLADLDGGTPYQVALGLGRRGRLGERWAVLGGVSLPLLLEALLRRDSAASPSELAASLAALIPDTVRWDGCAPGAATGGASG